MFTWLCTICRHEIATWCARAGKSPTISLAEDHPDTRAVLDALVASVDGDPETTFRREEVGRLVRTTLDHLPSRYATVLEWRYILELSVDEIATRLGIGYKAAESLLSRARVAFRAGFSGISRTLPGSGGPAWPPPSTELP